MRLPVKPTLLTLKTACVFPKAFSLLLLLLLTISKPTISGLLNRSQRGRSWHCFWSQSTPKALQALPYTCYWNQFVILKFVLKFVKTANTANRIDFNSHNHPHHSVDSQSIVKLCNSQSPNLSVLRMGWALLGGSRVILEVWWPVAWTTGRMHLRQNLPNANAATAWAGGSQVPG